MGCYYEEIIQENQNVKIELKLVAGMELKIPVIEGSEN